MVDLDPQVINILSILFTKLNPNVNQVTSGPEKLRLPSVLKWCSRKLTQAEEVEKDEAGVGTD